MRALALIATLLAANEEYSRFVTAAARLFESLEYERALDQLGNAKKFAKTADEQTEVALYEGVVLLELGRADDAKAALQTALYLSPDAKLPVKVSPKVAAQVEAIRAQVKKDLAPILAKKDEEARAKAKAAAEEEEKKRKAEEAARLAKKTEPPPPPAKKDEPPPPPPQKDEPKVATLEPSPSNDAPPPQLVEQPPPPKKKGLPVLSLIFLGGAAGTGIAGAVFGSQSNALVDEARMAQYQDDSMKKLDDARPKATAANVLFATTAALGVAAVISAIVWAASE